MRVLVLGAIGLIGNNVVRSAITAGWEVVVFDRSMRRGRRHPALDGLDVEMTPGRQDDSDALRQAMAGCQAVFHTRAYAPPNGLRHAHRLVEARQHVGHVLRAAAEAHIGRLVFTSSVSTIGSSDIPGRLPDEWNHYRLGSIPHPYWDAMLVQEEAVLAFGREKGIPVVIVNKAEVLGRYDFGHQTCDVLIDIARRGKRQYLPGKVSIADAEDVAQGHLAAASAGRPGERYILGGHNVTRQEMVAVVAHAGRRPAPDQPIDLDQLARMARFSERLSCAGRPNRPFPLGHQLAITLYQGWYESGKARQELGYANRPLAETCRSVVAWLKSVGGLR